MSEGFVYDPYNLNKRIGGTEEEVVIFDPYDLNRRIAVPKKKELPHLSKDNPGVWDPCDLSRRIG